VSDDGGDGDGDADPIRLRGAQREIRDAYFASDSGLFTLDCVSGAGRRSSPTTSPPPDILRRYAAGDPTPEQHVTVVSFNRDEAADIVPAICDRLQAIVEHDLVPTAADISGAELRYLRQRVRQAPYAGIIGTPARDIPGIRARYRFRRDAVVGNDALLKRVHRDCYESLRNDPEHARLRDLEAAYPDGEYDEGVDENAGGRADVLPRSTPLDRGVPVGAGTDTRFGVSRREAGLVRRYRAIRRAICQR